MSTQHSVAEPEVGQLVFQAVGTLAFDNLDDCAAFPIPKGYAKHVACSSEYGVTCFADGGGVRVIATEALVTHADAVKEKLASEQLCPPDAFATVSFPDVSCVAFSPCETVLAVCVGCEVRFLETRALVACARDPTGASPPEPFAVASLGSPDHEGDRVRDFTWQYAGLAYLALVVPEDSDEGKLFVGTAGADDGVDIADRVVAVAMAPPPDGDEPRWIHSCEIRRKASRPVRPGAGRRVGASRRPGGLRQTQRTRPRRGDARSVHRRHRGRHDRRGRGGTRVRTPAGPRAHRRRARTRRSEHTSRPGLGRRNPRGFQLLGQRLATAAGDVRGDRGNLRHRRRRDDWIERAVPARRTRPSVERGTRVASKSVG